MPDRITHDILAEIVEIASDAVICMDALQRVTFFNKGAEAIFGWTPGEIIGQRIETLIPERYRGNHERQVETFGKSRVKARRMGERREIAGIRKNGEEFPAEAAISQVGEGDDIVFTVALRDVTVRKRFEQRQQFLAEATSGVGADGKWGRSRPWSWARGSRSARPSSCLPASWPGCTSFPKS